MEVCPAYEYRFIGIRRRVSQLLEHNRECSAEVLHVLFRNGQPCGVPTVEGGTKSECRAGPLQW